MIRQFNAEKVKAGYVFSFFLFFLALFFFLQINKHVFILVVNMGLLSIRRAEARI